MLCCLIIGSQRDTLSFVKSQGAGPRRVGKWFVYGVWAFDCFVFILLLQCFDVVHIQYILDVVHKNTKNWYPILLKAEDSFSVRPGYCYDRNSS